MSCSPGSQPLLMKNGDVVVGPPSIEGSRVVLTPMSRRFALDMLQEFTAAVTAWMFPRPLAHLAEACEFTDEATRRWQCGTDLTFAILDKSSQEFLGVCAVHGRGDPHLPEFGIWLKSDAH